MAVTLTADQLATRIEGATENAEWRLSIFEAARARVEREAPGAPAEVQNEALTRYAGYLAQSDFGAFRGETIGPRAMEYVANHANAWRHCGAAGLLAPWRIRRAGAIA